MQLRAFFLLLSLLASVPAAALSISFIPGAPQNRATMDDTATGGAFDYREMAGFSRASSRAELNAAGTLVTYAAGGPAQNGVIGFGGVGFFPARSYYFKNSLTPVTQTDVIPAASFPVSMTGPGSITVSATGITGSCVGATITASAPCVLYNPTANNNLTVTVSGLPTCVNVERSTNAQTTIIDPTPCVPTAAAIVSGAADVDFVNLADVGSPATVNSVAITLTVPQYTLGSQILGEIADSSGGNNSVRLYLSATHALTAAVISSGAIVSGSTLLVSSGVLTTGVQHKIVLAIGPAGYTVDLDGLAVRKLAFANSFTGYTRFYRGSSSTGGGQCGCYIQSVRFFDGMLSDTQAQIAGTFPTPFPVNATFFQITGNSQGSQNAKPYLTPSPLNGSRNTAPNDYYNAQGCNGLVCSSYQYGGPGITGVSPAYSAAPNPPFSPSFNEGENPLVALMAALSVASPTANYIARNETSSGRSCAQTTTGTAVSNNQFYDATKMMQSAVASGQTAPLVQIFDVGGSSDIVNSTTYASFKSCINGKITSDVTSFKGITSQANVYHIFEQVSNVIAGNATSPGNSTGGSMDPAQVMFDDSFAYPNNTTLANTFTCMPGYGMPRNPVANLHKTSIGQQITAGYFAKCYSDVLATGSTLALHPTSVTFNTARNALNVGVSDRASGNTQYAVAIDNGIGQGAALASGFVFSDTCGDGIKATATTVTNAGGDGTAAALQVTLSGAVATGCTPTLSYAYVGTPAPVEKYPFSAVTCTSGVISATTSLPHGLVVGLAYPMNVTGFVPTSYNYASTNSTTAIDVTAVDTQTLSWPVSTCPAAATTLGAYQWRNYVGAWGNITDTDPRTFQPVGLASGLAPIPLPNRLVEFQFAVPGG